MQQRRLRPGDVLDDYCPRERRVTDHAIVAMIDDEIKQTRCVSCDTEHEYKEARVPPQRRKKAAPALFTQVLDGLQGPARLAHAAAGPPGVPGSFEPDAAADSVPPPFAAGEPGEADAGNEAGPPGSAAETAPADERAADEGPVRRPLIRAQLPRLEGQPAPTRELPDFTVRQPGSGRGTNRPNANANAGRGHRRGGGQAGQSGPRFAGQGRPGSFGRPGDQRQGARQGHGQGTGRGPRQNRSRRGGKKH